MYSALNVGFTLGSLLGGIALAFHSNDVLHVLPWFATAAFLVNQPSPAATGVARRAHAGRREKVPAPSAAQPRLAAHELFIPATGPARCCPRRRHPAVAGAGDRRAAGAAGVPLRHQR